WAPVVVTEPPLRSVLPAASVARLLRAVAAPTAPLKEDRPPVLTARPKPPLTVPPSVMAPEAVAVSVVLAPRLTASPYVCAPVVVTVPPLRLVLPGASVVRLVRAVAPPTAPLKVVRPPVLTARPKPPLTVLPKAMAPAPVEVSVVLADSTTASP